MKEGQKMQLKNFPDQSLLSDLEVLRRISKALQNKKPFSLIRIGDGENVVMSQYNILPPEKFLKTIFARHGEAVGYTLPNIKLRDQMLEAVRQADIVGVLRVKNDGVMAPKRFKRPLTNKIFAYYHLRPPALCSATVNRRLVSRRLFWEILHKYRVLLISRWAKQFTDVVTRRYSKLKPNIVAALNCHDYSQLSATFRAVTKEDFDLALISAGVNAVILAPKIAQNYQKVALDFGHVMFYLVKNSARIAPWKPSE